MGRWGSAACELTNSDAAAINRWQLDEGRQQYNEKEGTWQAQGFARSPGSGKAQISANNMARVPALADAFQMSLLLVHQHLVQSPHPEHAWNCAV